MIDVLVARTSAFAVGRPTRLCHFMGITVTAELFYHDFHFYGNRNNNYIHFRLLQKHINAYNKQTRISSFKGYC